MEIIKSIIDQTERILGLSKQVVGKFSYSIKVMLSLTYCMHLIACGWILLGKYCANSITGSWLSTQMSQV